MVSEKRRPLLALYLLSHQSIQTGTVCTLRARQEIGPKRQVAFTSMEKGNGKEYINIYPSASML